jgi:hypothetical protein
MSDLLNQLFGKTSTGSTSVNLTPEQSSDIQNTLAFKQGVVQPTYLDIINKARQLYGQNAGGVLQAAQNQGGIANQVQQTTGQLGESAARTGTAGLESLFSPGYAQSQLQAALAPAQAQYAQNLANQQANFGGAGELGSARQALAGQQLASTNAMNQGTLAAQIQANIENQRAQAANQLMTGGQNYLNQALGAAGTQLSASQVPTTYLNTAAQLPLSVPPGSYAPPYPSNASTSTSTQNNQSLFNTLGQLFGGF